MKMNPLTYRGRESKLSFRWLAFSIFLLLLIGCYVGLRFGAISYSHRQLMEVVRQPFTNSKLQDVIIDIRLPRILAALLVGSAMAVAGAMMQGITRNPIADPGLLGINTGAGLALAAASAFTGGLHYTQILLVCFLGSTFSALLVFTLAYRPKKGYHQLRLVLAGAMIATLCSALGQGLTIYFKLADSIIGWQAGGFIGVNWTMLAYIAPAIVLGLILAQVSSHQLTVLSLNENVAKALGQRTFITTLLLLGIVLILSASSVALVGSLNFIGLIIPHFVRLFVPRNYQLSLPLTALAGATFMIWVDIICRTFNPPYETPLNAIIALIGLPSFIILMRGRKGLG